MIGSFFCGIMSDKIGRKRVLFIAIIIQIICGALLIVAPTWWLFAILKAGTGLSHPGVYAIAIVLGTEVVGAHYRRIVAVGTATAVAIGELILDGMAYLIDDYRILHAAIVGPSLILLSYWWIVPESTRWLVVKERYKEADLILKRAARLNGSAIPERWWEELVTSQVSKHTSAGLIDLFRTPEIRKRTLVCFFVWFVNAMMYYGLTMKSDIGGGCAFVFFLIDPVGRRIIVAICFLIAGVCLLLNWLIGDNVAFYWGMLQIMITKGAVTASFIAVYTHTAELFPTVIRTTAVGCCSTMSRLGAVISSYMALWLVDNFGKLSMVIPFSTLSFVSAILTAVFLPETVNKPMPETISDVEDKKL
ncbi:transporter, major facilitator family protein [Ancylostoma ceylanicum]|uniref:Transporter, major facilitator family protein n=1 Tax=Ancylostoma ceylanicum TaxID=53326 RepID=A0A0D6LHA9_9BILA|nr:transporter, major facilitator family protein [Ancylostoma ceylanicum]